MSFFKVQNNAKGFT